MFGLYFDFLLCIFLLDSPKMTVIANKEDNNRYGHCMNTLSMISIFITVSLDVGSGIYNWSFIFKEMNSIKPVDPGVSENEFAVLITSVATI